MFALADMKYDFFYYSEYDTNNSMFLLQIRVDIFNAVYMARADACKPCIYSILFLLFF